VFSDRLCLSALTELETAYGPDWRAADLDRLVSSCSRLQKLSLSCATGLQLTALLQLTDLVQLWLTSEVHSSTVASLAQLSALQRLQRLAISSCHQQGNEFFAPLTALTQLTYLALPRPPEPLKNIQLLFLRLHAKPPSKHAPWPTDLCYAITNTVGSWQWL